MLDLRRRDFIALLGGAAAAWPLVARAQPPNRVRHIGVFLGLAQSADDPGAGEVLRPFQAAMREAGCHGLRCRQLTAGAKLSRAAA
jgi:hypothetical protein